MHAPDLTPYPVTDLDTITIGFRCPVDGKHYGVGPADFYTTVPVDLNNDNEEMFGPPTVIVHCLCGGWHRYTASQGEL